MRLEFDFERVRATSSQKGVTDGIYRLIMESKANASPGRIGLLAVVLNIIFLGLIIYVFASTLCGLISFPILMPGLLWRRRDVKTEEEAADEVRAWNRIANKCQAF